ncbi:hypothetical protein GW915_03195 [bacterium]|nr:hypothetical protein [bacterium]
MLGSLFLIFGLLSSTAAFSHSQMSEISPEKLLSVYSEIIKTLEGPFASGAEKRKSWFVFEGDMVAFDESKMNEALAQVVLTLKNKQALLEDFQEEQASEEPLSEAGFFQRSYLKFKSLFGKAPFATAQLAGASASMIYEHGPLLFAVIAVSQVSWELLESVVSVAVGAGGAHVACTIFNAALLATATSANRTLKLMRSFPEQLSYRQKMGSAFISLLRALKAGFAFNKVLVQLGTGGRFVSASGFEKMLEEKGLELSSEEDFFVDEHFVAPVWAQFHQIPRESSKSSSVKEDLDNVFNGGFSSPSRMLF